MSAVMKKMILLPFLCIMLSYMVSPKDQDQVVSAQAFNIQATLPVFKLYSC